MAMMMRYSICDAGISLADDAGQSALHRHRASRARARERSRGAMMPAFARAHCSNFHRSLPPVMPGLTGQVTRAAPMRYPCALLTPRA